MPITSIDLIDMKAKRDRSRFITSTRTYLVIAPTSMSEVAVLDGLGFDIFDVHPDDPTQFIRDISVDLRDKNLGHHPAGEVYAWAATLEYGPWDPTEASETGDPTEKRPKIGFEGVKYQEAADLDIDGKPVVNTAGDYFDPPVMRDRTRPVIRITRNEAAFSDSTILAYADKVNSDTFYGYPPRTLKIDSPIGREVFSQFLGAIYYEVEYRFEYNPATWKARPLNQGYRQLATIDSAVRQVAILDGQGQFISSPAFLDADGVKLDQPIDETNVVQLDFKIYQELDFTATFAFPTGILT